MQIMIFAVRFERGAWREWKHICDENEAGAVVESGRAIALEHNRPQTPLRIDYLEGARYIFDVARGLRGKPTEGDTHICGVKVDEAVIGQVEELEQNYALTMSA